MNTIKSHRLPDDPKLNDRELIIQLRIDIRRIKEERNGYELELIRANREINKLRIENKNYENYINLNSK